MQLYTFLPFAYVTQHCKDFEMKTMTPGMQINATRIKLVSVGLEPHEQCSGYGEKTALTLLDIM